MSVRGQPTELITLTKLADDSEAQADAIAAIDAVPASGGTFTGSIVLDDGNNAVVSDPAGSRWRSDDAGSFVNVANTTTQIQGDTTLVVADGATDEVKLTTSGGTVKVTTGGDLDLGGGALTNYTGVYYELCWSKTNVDNTTNIHMSLARSDDFGFIHTFVAPRAVEFTTYTLILDNQASSPWSAGNIVVTVRVDDGVTPVDEVATVTFGSTVLTNNPYASDECRYYKTTFSTPVTAAVDDLIYVNIDATGATVGGTNDPEAQFLMHGTIASL